MASVPLAGRPPPATAAATAAAAMLLLEAAAAVAVIDEVVGKAGVCSKFDSELYFSTQQKH